MNNGNNMQMPSEFKLAFAYIPFQIWDGNLYDPERALCAGTIFPALNQPMTDYVIPKECGCDD